MKKHNTSIPALAFLFSPEWFYKRKFSYLYPHQKNQTGGIRHRDHGGGRSKGTEETSGGYGKNGITQMDGFLIGDKRTGKWFNYYPNGVLLSVAEYENGNEIRIIYWMWKKRRRDRSGILSQWSAQRRTKKYVTSKVCAL